jgi:hypothetical protein
MTLSLTFRSILDCREPRTAANGRRITYIDFSSTPTEPKTIGLDPGGWQDTWDKIEVVDN